MSHNHAAIHIRCNGKESHGAGQVTFYTTGGAVLRGLKFFGLTLLGAVFSILLPGLHFITVPLGLLAAPFVGIFGFMSSRDAIRKLEGAFQCPECNSENPLLFRARQPPYYGDCIQCKSPYAVTPILPG